MTTSKSPINEFELALDTLYFRRTDAAEDCLVHNLAFEELKSQSVSALSAIEEVICDQVGVDFVKFDDHPYHGLNDLIGAYMIIGSRYDCSRIIDFLCKLSAPLQARAIGLIPVYFQKYHCRQVERDTNSSKPAITIELLRFIEQSLHSENELIKESANRSMCFYR